MVRCCMATDTEQGGVWTGKTPPSGGSTRPTYRSVRVRPFSVQATSNMTVSLEKPVATGMSMLVTVTSERSGKRRAIQSLNAGP